MRELEESFELHSMSFYEPKYDFASSQAYAAQLDVIRDKQKRLLKNKEAAISPATWQVNGSITEGKKQIAQTLRLMLRAFNGECDACVSKVRYNNITVMENRIHDAFKKINECAVVQRIYITPEYLDLKISELRLYHEYQEKLQAERDEQRRIREQMREEEIAQRELDRAKEEAEIEERRATEALERARREVAQTQGAQQARWQSQLAELERRLTEAQQNKERAISRAQMTRSGHVYIISNIGSFGEHVYKIGMTRRLDPLERVRELSGASVPFLFDVHAVIFSEDAPALESELHRKFSKHRVNRINERKEFFRVPLQKIMEVVQENQGEIEWVYYPDAKDYRQTIAMNKEQHNVLVA